MNPLDHADHHTMYRKILKVGIFQNLADLVLCVLLWPLTAFHNIC